MLSSIICCNVHTVFATNQSCSVYSLPMPMKIGSFIVFSMFNGGGGGVCGGGGGGGGVDV